MKNIVFLCQGNICRSPAAEALLKKYLADKNELEGYSITSRALERSTEGMDIEPRMAEILDREGVPHEKRQAHRVSFADIREADFLIVMETYHKVELSRLLSIHPRPDKIKRLLDFTSSPRDIADPYYTGDFEKAYQEIEEGVKGLLTYLEQENSPAK